MQEGETNDVSFVGNFVDLNFEFLNLSTRIHVGVFRYHTSYVVWEFAANFLS